MCRYIDPHRARLRPKCVLGSRMASTLYNSFLSSFFFFEEFSLPLLNPPHGSHPPIYPIRGWFGDGSGMAGPSPCSVWKIVFFAERAENCRFGRLCLASLTFSKKCFPPTVGSTFSNNLDFHEVWKNQNENHSFLFCFMPPPGGALKSVAKMWVWSTRGLPWD